MYVHYRTRQEEIISDRKDWVNIAFLTLTPVIGILGTALYTWQVGFRPWMAILAVTMYLAVGISICAGYHRFFSHKSYECSPLVQVVYAIFGAMAAQNSILWWSSSHRVHHKHVDKDWDPYNIRRGFWWAHMVWVFYKNDEKETFENAPDLLRNRVVMWQHRWHKAIMVIGGFGLPLAIGAMFGDPIAGLLWGGFLRIVIIHQTTFFVNSLAHTLGKPAYNSEVSARDNWLVALLTLGEGYHSFHHRFPSDFRNGIHWFQWDPAKWFIRGLRWSGLASDLRHTPPPQVEHARVRAMLQVVEPRLARAEKKVGEEVRRRMNRAVAHLERALALWHHRHTRGRSRLYVKQSRRQWKGAMRLLERAA